MNNLTKEEIITLLKVLEDVDVDDIDVDEDVFESALDKLDSAQYD